jgi:hypothetical protein
MTAAENEVNVPMGNILKEDMMRHAAEGCNTRTGANKVQIFFDGLGQGEHSLGTAERQFAAYFHLIEQIVGAGSVFEQHNDQLDGIGAIGPGCNGIAAYALIELFMYGQVQGNELTGFEIER